VIEDLVEWREKLLEDFVRLLPTPGPSRTVGIPRTMFYYDRSPSGALFPGTGF
jgi:hypothetical protein